MFHFWESKFLLYNQMEKMFHYIIRQTEFIKLNKIMDHKIISSIKSFWIPDGLGY